MSDQSKLGLGQIIKTPQQRDAIHIAVMPIVAGASFKPGAHVGIHEGVARFTPNPVGIVDPFLKKGVHQGDTFWLYLYPGTVTGLRHMWSHPDIAEETPTLSVTEMSESERWLRDFAGKIDQAYESLLDVCSSHCEGAWGDYFCEGGRYEGYGTPKELWEHYFNVTGKKPKDSTYGTPGIFSCSC